MRDMASNGTAEGRLATSYNLVPMSEKALNNNLVSSPSRRYQGNVSPSKGRRVKTACKGAASRITPAGIKINQGVISADSRVRSRPPPIQTLNGEE